MNREELDDLVDKWHDSDTKVSLHEYLGMSREEYSVWVEFDILPDEPITREKFLALRSDAYRWANDADNYLTENRRYKEAVSELRAVAEDDWITDVLDRNNI
jgi:hypothetical protein